MVSGNICHVGEEFVFLFGMQIVIACPTEEPKCVVEIKAGRRPRSPRQVCKDSDPLESRFLA